MWIGSYKIEKNVLPPDWVIDKLREHYIELKQHLIKKYGKCFYFRLEFSMHSEAGYLFVVCKRSLQIYKISFRSHDNYRKLPYNKEIFLYKFKTWKRCEGWFLKRCFPKVLEELNVHEYETQK